MAHIGKLRTATRPTIRSAVAADGLPCRIDHGLPADHVAGPGLKRPIEGLVAGVVSPILLHSSPPAGALWRLDGDDLRANLVRLGVGDRIPPHQNDEVEVVVVAISGRGELTLGGQVHRWPRRPWPTCPRGRSGRWWRSTGRWPTCRSTAAARRACRSVGPPSGAETLEAAAVANTACPNLGSRWNSLISTLVSVAGNAPARGRSPLVLSFAHAEAWG